VTRVDAAKVAAVRAELARTLDDRQLRDDPATLAIYGHDESDTADHPADLVVFARGTTDVQLVLRTAVAHGVPVTPVAARTGKSGGCLPLRGGISLSLEQMNQIIDLDVVNLTATLQPGVITGSLMRTVEEKGLFYPPDPNSWESCTMGGNIAENAGGPRALKYGVTRDYVIGLEWVLPTGEVIRTGRKTIKGVAGYDLVGLLVGSEGTLGVATEITVQLLPLPRHVMTALLVFPDVAQAVAAVNAVLGRGVLPRCLELLDDVSVGAVAARGVAFPPGAGAAVIAEVDGNVEDALMAELAIIDDVARQHGALETLLAHDATRREQLWAARRHLSTSLRALKAFKISEDIAVPRSQLATYIARAKQLGKETNLTVATYGHAGDGNLHTNILYDSVADRPRVDAAVGELMALAVKLGGTITGEHGVGSAKQAFIALEQARPVIDLQKALKRLFDPAGLLNPGKIFPD
jgi:glycolate oxidase